MTRRRTIQIVVVAAVIVALLLLPLGVDSFTESLMVTAGVYVLLALAWNLMAGFVGLMSFGLAGFFGIGAYTFGVLSSSGLPLIVKFLASGLASGIVGLVLIPCFRARGVYFAIATLAIAETLQVIARNFFPGGTAGLYFSPSFDITGHAAYWWTAGFVIVVVGVTVLLRFGPKGRELAAVKGDPEAAESIGVNVLRTRTQVTVLASAIAGIAGALLAASQTFVDPDTFFSVQFSLVPLLMVIVGGMGTILGPVIGAIGWRALDEAIRSSTTTAGAAAYTAMVYGGVLIIFAIFVPNGILGLFARAAGRRRVPWARRRLAVPAALLSQKSDAAGKESR